jgi:NAD+ diphosphatase
MRKSIFNASSDEASARLAFAGSRLDRHSEHRAADCLEAALADPRSLAFAVAPGGRVLTRSRPNGHDALFPLAALAPLSPVTADAVVIGFADDGAPRLAVSVVVSDDAPPEGCVLLTPRTVYAEGILAGDLLGQLAQAVSMANWTTGARFCGRCGAATVGEAGGYRRRCTGVNCAALHFPRTDPVVIMLAVDEAGDRCLLGRSPHFPPGMYSCLAGFLEPGETMEDAVRRETREESGITIGRVRYHASQPWPAPHSVMNGFYAEALDFDVDRDAAELEDCRWFSRGEAARLLERRPGELTTAPDGAIANLLLADWVAGRIASQS